MDEGEQKESLEPVKQKNSSTGLTVGIVILLLAVGVGAYFMNRNSESQKTPEEISETPTSKPTGQSLQGQKLSDTNFASNAVMIYPGKISASAQAAMSGWDLKTKTLADGTTQVDLVPTGSEATEGDISHTFNLKTGESLYFVDLNPGDDQPGMDNNKNDDRGIIVDAQGVIQ